MKYVCTVCGYVYDEEKEGVPFAALRVLSDSGDGSAPMVYRALVERASDLSSRILLQLLS